MDKQYQIMKHTRYDQQHCFESCKESIDEFLSRDLNRPSIEELMSLLRDDIDEDLIFWQTRVSLSFQCPASSLSLMTDGSFRALQSVDLNSADSTTSKSQNTEKSNLHVLSAESATLLVKNVFNPKSYHEHSDSDDRQKNCNQMQSDDEITLSSQISKKNLIASSVTRDAQADVLRPEIEGNKEQQPEKTHEHNSCAPVEPAAPTPNITSTGPKLFRRSGTGKMSAEEHRLRRQTQNREAQRRFRQRMAAARGGDCRDDGPGSPAERSRLEQGRTHVPAALKRALEVASKARRRPASFTVRRVVRSRF